MTVTKTTTNTKCLRYPSLWLWHIDAACHPLWNPSETFCEIRDTLTSTACLGKDIAQARAGRCLKSKVWLCFEALLLYNSSAIKLEQLPTNSVEATKWFVESSSAISIITFFLWNNFWNNLPVIFVCVFQKPFIIILGPLKHFFTWSGVSWDLKVVQGALINGKSGPLDE